MNTNNTNRVKCRFLDRKFVIDGKHTICTLKAEIPMPNYMPDKVHQWIVNHPSLISLMVIPKDNASVIRIELFATAKCAPNDTFNKVIGRRLSECRAKRKTYRFCYVLFSMMKTEYDNICTKYLFTSAAFSRYTAREDEHEKQITCSK